MRDRLFAFLTPAADNNRGVNPETLPLVPIAVRIVMGIKVVGGASRTHPPFPRETRLSKKFRGILYHGSVTEHFGTLDGGNPELYHVLYTDGDEEDVDEKKCAQMAHLHNETLLSDSHTRHMNMCGLMYKIFTSAAPVAKESVFTRAKALYGSDGPDVGHPFAGKYDIVDAVFDCITVESQQQRYKFRITDSQDDRTSTSASLIDGRMRECLLPGDRLRLEVVSASLRHAQLRVPTCVGFLNDQRDKRVVVINISVLGFLHKDTKKFQARPFAVEFVHRLHRNFNLATTCSRIGDTLHSQMFGAYPLVFCAEDGLDEVTPLFLSFLIHVNSHPFTFAQSLTVSSTSLD